MEKLGRPTKPGRELLRKRGISSKSVSGKIDNCGGPSSSHRISFNLPGGTHGSRSSGMGSWPNSSRFIPALLRKSQNAMQYMMHSDMIL
jgi:hypothetical protein